MRTNQLFVVIFVACIFNYCCTSTNSRHRLYENLIRQLGDHNAASATKAVDKLIQMGKPALPFVLSESEASIRFYGSCGVPIRSSDFLDIPLPESALTEDERLHPELLPADVRAFLNRSVDDAKLFIAVSLGKRDPSSSLFQFCKLTRDGTPVDPVIVLAKLRDLYYSTPSPGASYSREAIDLNLQDIGIDGIDGGAWDNHQ